MEIQKLVCESIVLTVCKKISYEKLWVWGTGKPLSVIEVHSKVKFLWFYFIIIIFISIISLYLLTLIYI